MQRKNVLQQIFAKPQRLKIISALKAGLHRSRRKIVGLEGASLSRFVSLRAAVISAEIRRITLLSIVSLIHL